MTTRQAKAAARVAAVTDELARRGWVPDGATRAETVRVGTSASPVYGGTGGELRHVGGRARFRHPDATPPRKATVGPVTTCVYEVVGGEARGIRTARTSDLVAVLALVDA